MKKRLSMIAFCKKHCGISLLLALLFLMLTNISSTYSWQSVSQQALGQAIGLVEEEKGYGNLEISKTVRNANGSAPTAEQQAINLGVTVTFGGNLPEHPEYAIILIDAEVEALSTTNYEFTFSLRHGQTMLIENIPVGVTYLITETPVSGFIYTSWSRWCYRRRGECPSICKYLQTWPTTKSKPRFAIKL